MFFIDRIEENIAVIFKDDKFFKNINIEDINGEAVEGSVITMENGVWTIDNESTIKRKNELRARLNKLFNKYN